MVHSRFSACFLFDHNYVIMINNATGVTKSKSVVMIGRSYTIRLLARINWLV